jgi:hypothetical protein
MDIFEIDRKLKENLDLIALKNTEISELQKNHNILLQQKRVAKFELVVENVEIGQVIELPQALTPLRYGDKIKIIRKNKKSVTVEILDNINSWNRDKRVGTIKRVPALNFGETIFYCKEIQIMIERNEKLKMILDV